jgi:rhodanese-related sulfurtransferase
MHERTKEKVVDQGDVFGIGDTLRANAALEVDRYVRDGETVKVGSLELQVLHTPGHTDNHICIRAGDMLFTGDLLLIGQAGRSDLPGGNTEQQYDSLFGTVLRLPDSIKIYPGHDYENREFALLGDERRTNPFLQDRSKEEYVAFVKDYFPPFAEATAGGGMTLQCGVTRVSISPEGYARISPAELASLREAEPGLLLLDVREAFELIAFGAISGVRNIPVGQLAFRLDELPADRNTPIAVVCQTGNRSSEAAHFLATRGYRRVFDLAGGTSAWKRAGHPVTRRGSKV